MYKHIADSYNELHGAEQVRKLRSLLAHASLPSGDVLDVGCGTAHLAPFFSDRRYVGVDPCQELLDHAPRGVEVLCARGEELPFGEESFPVVLSLTALHNYGDWRRGVEELFRVCGGVALVGVLKKSSSHDAIVGALQELFVVSWRGDDVHDSLLVLHKL